MRLLLIGVTIGLVSSPDQASAQDLDAFMTRYREAESHLTRHYLSGYRILIDGVSYDQIKRNGTRVSESEYKIVTDSRAIQYRVTSGLLDTKTTYSGGGMWYGFESYSLDLKPAGGTFALREHKSHTKSHAAVDDLIGYCRVFAPLSWRNRRRLSVHLDTMADQARRGYEFRFVSADPVRRDGYDAVRVVTDTGSPTVRTTTYLDAGNHLAFREFEDDGMMDVPSRKKLPIKTSGVLTYKPGPNGYPVPAEYKEWYTYPDGRTVPKSEAVWRTFEKYTPTADDFDLEKQFGIKRLPPPAGLVTDPTPPGTARSWWWLYAVAAALAAVTAGLVWYARRRRAA